MNELTHNIQALCDLLNTWDRAYRAGRPLVSDAEFDRKYDELVALERQTGVILPDSPTRRVGADLSSDLAEEPHTIPVLSLDKVYSVGELVSWMDKMRSELQDDLLFTGEEKLDGVSLVVYYQEGVLVRALTRGDGRVGNVVTDNARTIRALPLRLPRPISVVVRGEVFLPKERFDEVNKKMTLPYANPRNLAAGTLRRIKSREVAEVPLEIIVYEGFFEDQVATHREVRERLAELGFPLSDHFRVFGAGVQSWVQEITQKRQDLPYEIDGLVFKLDRLDLREELGYTGHHPRWAMAYKFESPQGESTVLDIDVQIGRTGRATPVARIQPVSLGGATITNATLHNQAYIEALELGIGDRVVISRRGDVIPAVDRVLEKASPKIWQMPANCPTCNHPLEQEGAHHFCRNLDCPDILRQSLSFFTAKDNLDIETLGPETLLFVFEKYQVRHPEDLYTFDWDRLLEEKGFGPKKVAAIRQALQASKTKPFKNQLSALGIPELGPRTVEFLMDHGLDSWDTLVQWLQEPGTPRLLQISGFGETTVETLKKWVFHPLMQRRVQALRQLGFSFALSEGTGPRSTAWADQVWCVTGSFQSFNPRSLAEEEIKKRGGRVVGSVSSKLTHLLVGSSPGSKLDKALQLGVRVVREDEFIELLQKVPLEEKSGPDGA